MNFPKQVMCNIFGFPINNLYLNTTLTLIDLLITKLFCNLLERRHMAPFMVKLRHLGKIEIVSHFNLVKLLNISPADIPEGNNPNQKIYIYI